MAKLKEKAKAAEGQAPAAESTAATATAPGFTASAPDAEEDKKQRGRPNLVESRKAKIAAAVEAGAPFTYQAEATAQRPKEDFTCICGAKGQNAHVAHDKNGAQVLVGNNCLKYLTDTEGQSLKAPAKERKGRAGAPGISRQARLQEFLKQYTPPYKFVRRQEGPFKCACGGKGKNQVIVGDANGSEFALGNDCAASTPGVEIPKPEGKRQAKAKVAGLKGGVSTEDAAKPDLDSVG